MKPEKSFGEIWSELTDEQSEYLKGYINRQRIDAINTHEKVNANQIEKQEADKAELLEMLEKVKKFLNYVQAPATPAIRLRLEIESLLKKI